MVRNDELAPGQFVDPPAVGVCCQLAMKKTAAPIVPLTNAVWPRIVDARRHLARHCVSSEQ